MENWPQGVVMSNEENKPEWPWGFVNPSEQKEQPSEEKKETRGAPKGEGHASPTKEDVSTGVSYLKRKAEAKALFVQGFSLKTISKQIDVPSTVINKWAETESWIEEREEYMNQTTMDRIEEMRAGQEITLADLDNVKKTAIESIKDKKVVPKKFQESVGAYIQAEEMQRKIKVEAIQVQFLIEVAKVLREEISDTDLLNRIGNRLSKLYRQEQISTIQKSELLVPSEEDIVEENGST